MIWIALLLALLAGCTTPRWRADASDPAFKRDDYACTRDSHQAPYGPGLGGVIAARMDTSRFYRQCMESKGWQRAE